MQLSRQRLENVQRRLKAEEAEVSAQILSAASVGGRNAPTNEMNGRSNFFQSGYNML